MSIKVGSMVMVDVDGMPVKGCVCCDNGWLLTVTISDRLSIPVKRSELTLII